MAKNAVDIDQVVGLIQALAPAMDVGAIQTAVTSWLNNHPEATTTVTDGSITEAKLAAAVAQKLGLVTQLSDEIDNIVEEKHTDLLYGRTAHEKWFIDPSNGEGRTLASFYSYEDIPIPAGTKLLFPYNNFSEYKYVRSVCFFSDSAFISGVSGDSSQIVNGIPVPASATKVSCSLTVAGAGYDGTHYLSLVPEGDVVSYPLKNGVQLNSEQIVTSVLPVNNLRMPCINFQFDDGVTNDENIVTIFKAHNMKCGFAIISNISSSQVYRYLRYQRDGFEILSHSTDGTGMSDATVSPETIETKLKTSKEILENWGFKIRGFVTPNSTMASIFKPIIRKYYQYAETEYFGSYSGTGLPYMKPSDGVYNGFRISLQTTTLANQEAAVDECIANYGCLTFYGHAAALDTTDNLTTENLNALLTYIADKSGACIVDTPSNIIEQYFAVRNDDISNDWVDVTSSEAGLDERFTVNSWAMRYSKRMKLFYMFVRVAPTEALSGQVLFLNFPVQIIGNPVIGNELGRNCIVYSNRILVQGSGTWQAGTNIRFSLMCCIR